MKITIAGLANTDNSFDWEHLLCNKGVYQVANETHRHLVFISFGDLKHILCVENNDIQPCVLRSDDSWKDSRYVLTDKVVTFKN